MSIYFGMCALAVSFVTTADAPDFRKMTYTYKTVGDTKIHADVYHWVSS